MKRKSFTLVELVVVVIVALILATFGMATYRQVIDNAGTRVDQTHLRALGAAVEVYALENDSFPTTLAS